MIIKANLSIGTDITTEGNVSLTGGTLNLNGYELKILGNLTVGSNATVNLGSGNLKVNGNMSNYGSIKIETGKLEVNGDLESYDFSDCISEIKVGNGELFIGGNYSASGRTTMNCVLDIENGKVEIQGDFVGAKLKIQNDSAYMLVQGNMSMGSNGNSGNITGGIIELKGDFSTGTYYGNAFPATGTNKVILSGTDTQNIRFEYPTSSYFNVLVNKNPNATFKATNYKYLFTEIPYTLTIKNNKDDSMVYDFVDSTKETMIFDRLKSINTGIYDGYAFKGWYTDEACNTPLEDGLIKSDITIYGKWVQPLKIDSHAYSEENKTLSVSVVVDEELKVLNGTILIGVYDDNNHLIDVYVTNELDDISHIFANISISGNERIKIFYLSNLDTTIPLCENISVAIQ